jgi:hypothetical protein
MVIQTSSEIEGIEMKEYVLTFNEDVKIIVRAVSPEEALGKLALALQQYLDTVTLDEREI